jgi:hypothetical protein
MEFWRVVLKISAYLRQRDHNDPIKGNVKRKAFPWLDAEIIFLAFSPTV